ncbi:MAG: SGNH/GDSL hydrolase family protein, partial [Chryseobacterium sp.]
YMIFETGNLKDGINPSTPGVTPTAPISFIAEKGVYRNFGGVEVTGAAGYIVWNGTNWKVVNINLNLNTSQLDPESTEKAETGKTISNYVSSGLDSVNTKTKFIDIQTPKLADFFPLATDVESEAYSIRTKVANGGVPFSNLLIPLRNGVIESVLSERSYSKVIYKQNSLYGGQEYSDIGMGLCYVSNNGFGYPWHASISLITLASSPRFGKIEIKGSVNPTAYNTFYSDQTMSNYTLGDVIELSFERLYHDYIAIAKNLTKGTQIEFKVSPGNNFSNYIPYNTANPCIYLQSGDFSIYSYEYGTTLLNPEKKVEGDSITCGSGSILEPFRYASKIQGKGFNVISGGGADYTGSVRLRLNEIKFLRPKIVTLMIGGNDILFGIAAKTWGDNLDLIAYELGLLNIKVIMIYPTARAGAGQLINYIKSSIYLKDLDFIDCNTPTAVAGTTDTLKPEYDSGDALHPSNAGHSKVAEVINTYFENTP